MEDIDEIDLVDEKSEQVREILAKTPAWLVRWGTTVVLGVIVMLVVLSWVVHYPDVIRSEVTIITRNPPVDVVARVDGRLHRIFVKENQWVQTNTTLAVIENTASLDDVLILKDLLGEGNPDSLALHAFSDKMVLGGIQEPYNLFVKSCHELRLFEDLQVEKKRIRSTQKRLNENKLVMVKMEKQHAFFVRELGLVEHDYKRNQRLFDQKVISEKDFEERQKEYLQAARNVEALDAEISEVKITALDLEQELETLSLSRMEKSSRFIKAVDESREMLRQAVAAWEEKYLLIARTSGRVSFFDFWSEEQFVKSQEAIFTIVPDETSGIVGRLLLPVLNSGKVQVGQHVNVKLDNYPYHEFGMLRGTVVSMSLIPKRDVYVIEVALADGLTTTFHKKLVFRQAMKGSAEVITEDTRVLERIFFQVRKMFIR